MNDRRAVRKGKGGTPADPPTPPSASYNAPNTYTYSMLNMQTYSMINSVLYLNVLLSTSDCFYFIANDIYVKQHEPNDMNNLTLTPKREMKDPQDAPRWSLLPRPDSAPIHNGT